MDVWPQMTESDFSLYEFRAGKFVHYQCDQMMK